MRPTDLFNYSVEHSLLEKLISSQPVKKFPAFDGRIYKCPPPVPVLSQSNPVHVSPHPISLRSIPILSSHLCLGLFPSGFLTKTLYAPLLSPVRTTFPAHIILFDLFTPIIFGKQYTSQSSSLYSFLHSTLTSSLLGPNILLSTLFSYTLSLCSSLNVSDQVSHPYKTTGKIMVASMKSSVYAISASLA